MLYDYLIVGAGLAGTTVAERLAAACGKRVLVVDRRPHVAGNTFDPIGPAGIRVHRYGPHIFHTNSTSVVAYLSRFTSWRPYEHRVLARTGRGLVPIPINRTTINRFYGLALDPGGVAAFLRARAEPVKLIRNSRDAIVSKVGRELYETFFEGYTRKQWGVDPSELDATVCGRIPTRTGDDDRYFNDRFQAMPADGFHAMCARMLDHPRIDVVLGTSFAQAADRFRFRKLVYTGTIDDYFERRYGALPYRSLRFEFETVDAAEFQPVGCINEPDETIPYTRTTEYRHLTGERGERTVISREYPTPEGEPYYPIPRRENRALYERYRTLARREPHVTFVGRLAEYRYFNMDQVVASALRAFEDLAVRREAESA